MRREPLPDAARANALAHHERVLAGGPESAAPPRDAATVVLLRDGQCGPEVYLLRRHGRMAFAAGQAVFPGGSVDPRDRDADDRADLAWAGPPPAVWAERFGCDEATGRGLGCAAVRETYEESGVLLAGPGPDAVVDHTTGADWERDRAALESGERSLAEVLGARGLVVRSDLLGAWTHWVTPAFEPRRYDTRFFVAVLPPGQQARDVSGESDAVAWMRPTEAIEAVRDGRLGMMPPTLRTCEDVAGLDRAADVLAAAAQRRVVRIEPRLVVDDDGAIWLETEEGP